jgi:hypothetical protein
VSRTEELLTNEQIAGLSSAERQELIRRLSRIGDGYLPPREALVRMRRHRLGLMVISAAVLVPWTVFLALTLPSRYVARNWSLTWVGFDVLLLAMFATTALLGWFRRQLLIQTAFASAVLLLCDAWFDVTTASSSDIWWALASALLIEVPIALFLMSGTARLVRYMGVRFYYLEPREPLWRMPLVVPELFDPPAEPN